MKKIEAGQLWWDVMFDLRCLAYETDHEDIKEALAILPDIEKNTFHFKEAGDLAYEELKVGRDGATKVAIADRLDTLGKQWEKVDGAEGIAEDLHYYADYVRKSQARKKPGRRCPL